MSLLAEAGLLPEVGSVWEHHMSGQLYVVTGFSNMNSTRPEYPPMIRYKGLANGNKWSKPAHRWREKMWRLFAQGQWVKYDNDPPTSRSAYSLVDVLCVNSSNMLYVAAGLRAGQVPWQYSRFLSESKIRIVGYRLHNDYTEVA